MTLVKFSRYRNRESFQKLLMENNICISKCKHLLSYSTYLNKEFPLLIIFLCFFPNKQLINFEIINQVGNYYILNQNMKRELSYQFDLDIERVHLLINMKCDVQVWWKSGKGKIATKNSIKLQGSQKYFDVREKLSIIAKIVMQNGMIRQKKTQLLIILFTSQNTSKLGGRVYLNLAQFISPDTLTVPTSRKIERSLENCPDEASKIIFTLSCKYIQENFGGSQNPHDISFQANNNFGSSYSSNLGRSSSDMTFRPEKQKQQLNYRKQNSTGQPSNNYTNLPVYKNEFSPPQQKNRNILQKDWEKQKVDTPSWDRSQKDKQFQLTSNNLSGRNRQKQFQKPPIANNPSKPMQFSFNPLTVADRQKMGLDNTQIIRDLKQIAEQRGKSIKSLQDEILRLRNQLQQKSQKSSAKSLSLLNQLNTTTAHRQQLLRQKQDLRSQIDQLKQDNRKLDEKCKSIHFQFSDANNQLVSKLQQRKKLIDDLTGKLEEAERKASKYQDQIFRKDNQLIKKQKDFQFNQNNKQLMYKQQNQKLRNISAALKDLQSNFQKVFNEKEDLKKRYEQCLYKLQKSQESGQKISQNIPKLEQDLQKQKQRSKLLQVKYKQRESLINQIQNQFKLFSNEKLQLIKQKDDQLALIRDKFNAACKKMDEISGGQESMKNTISQKNVRIKTLQNICEQLEKNLEQKQNLIGRAKQYVKSKQQQVSQKDAQIVKRDEFIQKCRSYMQTKQKQYADTLAGLKSNSNTEAVVKKELKQKQKMLEEYINERHRMEKQIDDMGKLIDRLKERVMECQECMDELHRKNESQQSTLKDLVKKNLDMQIQLNVKDYQIQSLRGKR